MRGDDVKTMLASMTHKERLCVLRGVAEAGGLWFMSWQQYRALCQKEQLVFMFGTYRSLDEEVPDSLQHRLRLRSKSRTRIDKANAFLADKVGGVVPVSSKDEIVGFTVDVRTEEHVTFVLEALMKGAELVEMETTIRFGTCAMHGIDPASAVGIVPLALLDLAPLPTLNPLRTIIQLWRRAFANVVEPRQDAPFDPFDIEYNGYLRWLVAMNTGYYKFCRLVTPPSASDPSPRLQELLKLVEDNAETYVEYFVRGIAAANEAMNVVVEKEDGTHVRVPIFRWDAQGRMFLALPPEHHHLVEFIGGVPRLEIDEDDMFFVRRACALLAAMVKFGLPPKHDLMRQAVDALRKLCVELDDSAAAPPPTPLGPTASGISDPAPVLASVAAACGLVAPASPDKREEPDAKRRRTVEKEADDEFADAD